MQVKRYCIEVGALSSSTVRQAGDRLAGHHNEPCLWLCFPRTLFWLASVLLLLLFGSFKTRVKEN